MTITKATNIAAVLYGPKDLRMEERQIESPGPGEVQIHIRVTGICGSDLHYYTEGKVGPRMLEPGKTMILGHESSGVVTEIGSGVQHLKVGDRVAIEPGRACQCCARCSEGRYNLCPRMKFSSSLLQGPNDGSLRRFMCFPGYLCHRLPDTLSLEDGALMEPLAVAVHAVSRTPVQHGSTVVVVGAGPVGLLVAAAACAQGATRCFILDVNASRLAFASRYLPGIVAIQLPFPSPPGDPVEVATSEASRIHADYTMEDESIDVSFECVGMESTVNLAICLLRRGGTAMLLGMGKGRATISTDTIVTREISLLGNFRYANAYQPAIALVEQGKISLKELVTHRFRLEDTLQAFELASKGDDSVIKVQIGDF